MNREELLLKPVWTYRDVMLYCNVKKSKAFEIIAFCKKELNGAPLFKMSGVRRDSVLEYMSTTIDKERDMLKKS